MDDPVLLQVLGDGQGALLVLDEIDIALSDLEARIVSLAESSASVDTLSESLAGLGDVAATTAAVSADLGDGLAGLAGSATQAAAAEDDASASTSALSDAMWYLAASVNNAATMLETNTVSLTANTAALEANTAAAVAAGNAQVANVKKAAAAQTGFIGAVLAGGTKLKMLGLGIMVAGAAFTYFGAQAESALNVVAARTGATAAEMQYYTETAEALAEKYGYSLKNTADGIYYVISAGFKGKDATNILALAMQAASADGADLATVTYGLMSVMNSYGASAVQAQQYTNLMAMAVTDGMQTFQDFSSSISVAAVAGAQAKFSFQQVAAAEATLTQSGMAATRATQALRYLFNAIQDPGKVGTEAKALGLSFDEAAFKSMDLIHRLEYLQQISKGNITDFDKLVGGIRGTAAANVLLTQKTDATGHKYLEFNKIMADMSKNGDIVSEGFKTHTETLAYSLDKLGATLSVTAFHFEQMIKPELKGFIDGMTTAVQWLGEHSAVAAPLLGTLAVILGVVMVAALVNMAVAAWAAVAPMLPFIAIGLLVGAVIFVLVQRIQFLVAHWSQLGKKLQEVGGHLRDAVLSPFLDIRDKAVLIWTWITQDVGKRAGELVGNVTGTLGALPGKALAMMVSMGVKITTETGKLPGKFAALAGDIVHGFVNAMGNLGGKIKDAILSPFQSGIDSVKHRLGIASPSRVFADLGKNTGLGFIQGIVGQQRGVNAALTAMLTLPGTGVGGSLRPSVGALPTRIGGVGVNGVGTALGGASGAAAQDTRMLLTQMLAALNKLAQPATAVAGSTTTIGDQSLTFNGASQSTMVRTARAVTSARNTAFNLLGRAGAVRSRGNMGGHPLS